MKKMIAAITVLSLLIACSACANFNLNLPTDPMQEKNTGSTSEEFSAIDNTTKQTSESQVQSTAALTETQTTPLPITNPAAENNTTAPATKQPYESYSVSQIISEYQSAWLLTRNYTGEVSVHHTENFDANVVEASPGGALTTQLVNYVVGLVAKPNDETLHFSNGKAVNSEGETVPLLLPQKTNFSLPAEGIKSASIKEENGMKHITVVLKEESVSMAQTPTYNAGAIGFLDTSEFSFSIVKINSCNIDYSGSVIDAYINGSGYITKASYTINMTTKAEVSGLGISGSGTLKGSQVETWELNIK